MPISWGRLPERLAVPSIVFLIRDWCFVRASPTKETTLSTLLYGYPFVVLAGHDSWLPVFLPRAHDIISSGSGSGSPGGRGGQGTSGQGQDGSGADGAEVLAISNSVSEWSKPMILVISGVHSPQCKSFVFGP